ncbi:hypothetical protein L484_020048 [Morus notabilis]|uniref:Uncharacterized protein n=1 Tax=Morus notabilis TaxID=981085 RepID=W9SJQ8_9ROSA|nr:hypothetical protein L484_020048 [Morus notabilis]
MENKSGIWIETKKYKIVKIIYYLSNERGNLQLLKSDVQIFNFESSSWRSLGQCALMIGLDKFCSMEEFTRKLAHEGIVQIANISSFDITDQQFKEFPKPDGA